MKKHIINLLILILVFIVTAFFTVLTFSIDKGASFFDIGLINKNILVFAFAILFFISLLSLKFTRSRIRAQGILITMSLVLLILMILNGQGASFKYSLKSLPYFLSWIFGLIAGYSYFSRSAKKKLIPAILFIFPFLFSLGISDLWVHKIEYGNWTGEISGMTMPAIEFTTESSDVVNNASMKGKVVLLDFWFIGCGPCWVKFPEVQRIYDENKENPNFALYAVNRDDDPSKLFKKITDKGYSFPVVRGGQEMMDILDIYKYPTVFLINQNGEIVFTGELEAAEMKLKSMLSENSPS